MVNVLAKCRPLRAGRHHQTPTDRLIKQHIHKHSRETERQVDSSRDTLILDQERARERERERERERAKEQESIRMSCRLRRLRAVPNQKPYTSSPGIELHIASSQCLPCLVGLTHAGCRGTEHPRMPRIAAFSRAGVNEACTVLRPSRVYE